MPRLNADGGAVMGVGDGVVSFDRRPLIYRAGASCWLDTGYILANAMEPDGTWRAVRCRVIDGEVELLEDPPDGANELVAGGGRWLGWNPARGMFGSIVNARAGILAAGLDGTLAYCRDRQRGIGFVLHAPDGSEFDVPDAVVYDMQVLGPRSAIWYDGSTVRAVGRQAPRFAVPPGRTRLVTVRGEDWLVYWSEGTGLIAQVDGAVDGYVLELRPIAFNHDAVAADGQIVIAWSTTQGERPTDLVKLVLDRAAPRLPLALPIVTAPVPVPAPPAPSPIPPSPPRPAPPKEPPMPSTPSLDAWINQELPQLIAAFRGNSSNAAAMADDPHAPHAEWGSFQAYRRYVEGWTFPQMLHHEQTQGASQPSPSEPP